MTEKTIQIKYFALFRDQAGESLESVTTSAKTAGELYQELKKRHSFTLAPDELKVAIDGEFSSLDSPLSGKETVVFIPPVAGG